MWGVQIHDHSFRERGWMEVRGLVREEDEATGTSEGMYSGGGVSSTSFRYMTLLCACIFCISRRRFSTSLRSCSVVSTFEELRYVALETGSDRGVSCWCRESPLKTRFWELVPTPPQGFGTLLTSLYVCGLGYG